ncbi:MAG: hypothetical protein ABIP19_11380 [Dermatophilaceae bacterium]
MESTPSLLVCASNVSATTFRLFVIWLTTRPRSDDGIDVVGTGAFVPVIGFGAGVALLAGVVVADVAVAVLVRVTVADVVGPAPGFSGADWQEADSNSTPTARVMKLAPRNDPRTVASSVMSIVAPDRVMDTTKVLHW